MAFKKIEQFGPQDKQNIKGKVRHTRTGACTCRRDEWCFHGLKPVRFRSGLKKKVVSKVGGK